MANNRCIFWSVRCAFWCCSIHANDWHTKRFNKKLTSQKRIWSVLCNHYRWVKLANGFWYERQKQRTLNRTMNFMWTMDSSRNITGFYSAFDICRTAIKYGIFVLPGFYTLCVRFQSQKFKRSLPKVNQSQSIKKHVARLKKIENMKSKQQLYESWNQERRWR